MSLFANKTLMITGGASSFGNAMLTRFKNRHRRDPHHLPDEKKQDDMHHEF